MFVNMCLSKNAVLLLSYATDHILIIMFLVLFINKNHHAAGVSLNRNKLQVCKK
jgi:hypothetical protein